MRKKLVIIILMLGSAYVNAQDKDIAETYASEIKTADLREYLGIIASDALEGRKTGTRGQKMAASFIAWHFQDIGLQGPVNGNYVQPVDLYSNQITEAWISAGATRYDTYGDVFYFGSADSGGEVSLDAVFAGKGSDDDYARINVKDKAVVVMIPSAATGMQSFRKLSQTAREKGAKILFIVSENTNDEFHSFVSQVKGFFSAGSLSLQKPEDSSPNKGLFILNQIVAEKIFGIAFSKLKAAADDASHKMLAKVKPGKAGYGVKLIASPVKTENVLGFLEGTDKKDEVVLVTAHYDHIGTKVEGDDKVNNGADDDGSGTVSVMELAKVFAKAKREGHGPRRSILFMTVVAEEQGLFGSEYYVTHPVYPLTSTVVDLNIDMIGRTDPEHKEKPDYVYVIGSDKLSSQLHNVNEDQNKAHTQLALDYTYNDENHPTNLYKRSDHWNFAKNNIPIVFYFDGIHEDYHKPSDEISKINFDLLAKRATLVFYTAWEIANRSERIAVDRK